MHALQLGWGHPLWDPTNHRGIISGGIASFAFDDDVFWHPSNNLDEWAWMRARRVAGLGSGGHERKETRQDKTRRSMAWHGVASVTVTKGDGVHGESSVRDRRAHMQRRAAG